MRRLMLLRHAKAGPPGFARHRSAACRARAGGGATDRRPSEGRAAFPRPRPRLAGAAHAGDMGACSAIARGHGGELESRIYEASADNLLKLVRSVGPETRTLMVVGHNPGFQDLARFLVGYGDRYAFARMAKKYPTAGLAVIDFDADSWEAIGARGGRLDRFVTPNSLGAEEDD